MPDPFKPFKPKDIQELIDLFDNDEVTTADQVDRPQKALDREMFQNAFRQQKAGGGMLVEPGFGGVRQGYKDKKSKVKEFTATSGPGTGSVFDDPAAIDIVKAELNKIKKQRNNKDLFEWSEKSDWYKNLRKRLNPNTKKGLNREFTNKLINQVVDEFFPGAYHGKNAVTNFRNDMVVKSFIQHLKSVGEFDGQEKFDKVLDQFTKGKDPDHKYENINRSWKQWIAGEFEVDGVDRAQLRKELKARGINYNQITNWKASAAQARGVKKIAEIKFLDNQNTKFPNRTSEQVEKLFKQKFPSGNFYLRVNDLTQLKNTGVYVSGATSEKSVTGVNKGDRAPWLKQAYGQQFAGNYSKIINAADKLAAAGETEKAKRLYKAADKFFGPKGIIRKSAVGEAEHALARTFDFLNPDRQLAINSIVSGDLNQFKKNLFDVPVKNYFLEYNNPKTTPERRIQLKNLIEDRKKVMNAITGGQKKGIVAGDTVKFRYGKNSITATSNVPAVDTLFKEGKFNIDDFIERGNRYGEAFETIGKKANIIGQKGELKITKPVVDEKQFTNIRNKILQFAGTITDKCAVNPQSKKDGGRIGFKLGSEDCFKIGKKGLNDGLTKGFRKGSQQALLATQILKAGSAIKDAASLRALLGPQAMMFYAATEGALIGYDMVSKGKSLREAVADSVINLGLGPKLKQDPRKLFVERLQNLGVSDQEIGKGLMFDRMTEDVQTLNDLLQRKFIADQKVEQSKQLYPGAVDKEERKPPGFFGLKSDKPFLSIPDVRDKRKKEADDIAMDIQDIYRTGDRNVLDALEFERFQKPETMERFVEAKSQKDYLDKVVAADRLLDAQDNILYKYGKGDYFKEKDREQIGEVFDIPPGFKFAGGGIAKLAGIDEGPPPESGPNSQGLSGLLKRGNKI
jgi:hypothetical protein